MENNLSFSIFCTYFFSSWNIWYSYLCYFLWSGNSSDREQHCFHTVALRGFLALSLVSLLYLWKGNLNNEIVQKLMWYLVVVYLPHISKWKFHILTLDVTLLLEWFSHGSQSYTFINIYYVFHVIVPILITGIFFLS